MYYYGARYYDPRISIFVSVDPLADQTMEPYLYVGNNPIMFIDPSGMSKEGSGDGGGWLSNLRSNIKAFFGISPTKEETIDGGMLDEIVIETNRKKENSVFKWIKGIQKDASQWARRQGAGAAEFGKTFREVTEGSRDHMRGTLKPLYTTYGSMGGFGAPPTAIFGKAEKVTNALGTSRTSFKKWLEGVEELSRGDLIKDIERAGFKLKTPDNIPVQVYERKGLRLRVDPPQGQTNYNHMHIEYGGKSYDKSLNPVNRRSPEAHIPIQ